VTHYDVIQDVAEELGWKLQNANNKGNWDVLWTDHHIETETLIKMHMFQKISHYPGIHVLARKNLLGMSLMEMNKRFPSDYHFFPKTWLLPMQYPEIRQ
jgi:tubulin polyglutamylase TTLL6/13